MLRARTGRGFSGYENEGADGGRNGLGCETARVLPNVGTHTNIVWLIRKLLGGAGTPFVKAKGGALNSDSPPNTLTAAALTEYCPLGKVCRSYSSTKLPLDKVVALMVMSVPPIP